MNVHLKCLLTKEDKIYVAHCLDLDLIAEGDTKEESLANIKSAIEDYLCFVSKNKLGQKLIPRFAPLKYWKQYFESVKKTLKEKTMHLKQWRILLDVPA